MAFLLPRKFYSVMVGFGDKLLRERKQGWEKYYLRYDELKDIIESLKYDDSSSKETLNELNSVFFVTLSNDIERINSFYTRQESIISSWCSDLSGNRYVFS